MCVCMFGHSVLICCRVSKGDWVLTSSPLCLCPPLCLCLYQNPLEISRAHVALRWFRDLVIRKGYSPQKFWQTYEKLFRFMKFYDMFLPSHHQPIFAPKFLKYLKHNTKAAERIHRRIQQEEAEAEAEYQREQEQRQAHQQQGQILEQEQEVSGRDPQTHQQLGTGAHDPDGYDDGYGEIAVNSRDYMYGMFLPCVCCRLSFCNCVTKVVQKLGHLYEYLLTLWSRVWCGECHIVLTLVSVVCVCVCCLLSVSVSVSVVCVCVCCLCLCLCLCFCIRMYVMYRSSIVSALSKMATKSVLIRSSSTCYTQHSTCLGQQEHNSYYYCYYWIFTYIDN
jgi:hypothetical protein